MAEVPKLLYIVVLDEVERKSEGERNESFRYTRSMLQSALQLMGCKARHAFKISKRVFEVMRRECSGDALNLAGQENSELHVSGQYTENENDHESGCVHKIEVQNNLVLEEKGRTDSKPFELYKQRTTVVVIRERFLDVVCDALSEYNYVSPKQRADLLLACRIRERKESITVLLCGTSGCGKSTLSSLLGSRLGITTVISTDSIRHMMRSFVEEKQNPLLWSSTYHAGEFLDPVAVAEAKAKRKANKLAHISHVLSNEEVSNEGPNRSSTSPDGGPSNTEMIGEKQMAVEGFKAQSEMVIDSLDRLITAWEERKESVIVEGVHLSLNFVMGLMKKHPSIIPFMIYITNEDKHLERFAVRAKYMTLDPARNRYVKYIRNIRTIQEYLCNRADKHLVPKINNTNVDRSVAAIHATVFSCLRRREAGEQLYDPTTNTVALVEEEHRNQCAANSLSSKGMFQLIQRKGSSRHLMALLNTDGSVAKAWPVESDDNGKPISGHGSEKSIGSPVYGPVQIGKAEPVNLQFGNFGISVFPNDTGGTSHTGSVDEARAEWTENGSSRHYSSCCSSPRMSDGPAKEPKEERSVCGSDSDEQADDPPEVDSDEDLSDVEKQIHEEMEGSVDEDSTKSDEEYNDLAMRDGYLSDDEEESNMKLGTLCGDLSIDQSTEKYQHNLEHFMQSGTRPLSELICSYSSLVLDNQNNMSMESNMKLKRRSLSISPMGKNGSSLTGPIISGAPQR